VVQEAHPELAPRADAVGARLHDAAEGAERLTRLLALLFDTAALRAGKLELHRAPLDLVAQVRAQVAGLRIAAPERTIRLHLPASGRGSIAGVSLDGPTKFAQVESVVVGDHLSANQRVLVYNMSKLQQAGFAIRGLLGQDFLSQFDVFIDNAHSVLCIDDTGALRAGMQGSR